MPTLLPSNATELESSIDIVAAERMTIDIPIKDYQDPYRCPVNLLPWLAWERGVVYWNSAWQEDIKRGVINEAPAINRIKGTKAAITKALSMLGVTADYTGYAETGTAPGTFSITAFLSKNLDKSGNAIITPESTRDLIEVLNGVKRASFHYTLKTGIRHTLHVRVAGAVAGAISKQRTNKQALPTFTPTATLGVFGAAIGSISKSRIGMANV